MVNDGDQLVGVFFAPPNKLRLSDLTEQSPGTTDEVRDLFGRLLEDARAGDERPVLLPRVDDQGTLWYALAPDRRLRQMIGEDIRSFVGPTYADLGVMLEPLDHDDPIEAAILARIGSRGTVLRFRVGVEQRRAAIAAISAMRSAWEIRPRHLVSAVGGTAVMLRELNRAIASSDSDLAEAVLDRVRSSGRLSSANVAFSTIRVLEVGERWAEILALDEVGVVLAIPRPRAVTEALLRALYWTEIADGVRIGSTPDPQSLKAGLNVMRDRILPRYAALFRAVDGFRSSEAILLFALRAAAANPPRVDEVERLAETCAPDEQTRSVIDALIEHLRDSSVPTAAPSTESSFATEAVEAELRRAAEERKTHVREAEFALEAFGRGESPKTAKEALAVLNRLTPEEASELADIHRYEPIVARLHTLVPPGEDEIPDGWVAWARGLQAAPQWTGASDVLELAADSWAIDPLLSDEAAENFALTLMDARLEGGRDAAARALDVLVPSAESAVGRGGDVTSLGSKLVTVLLADEVVTEADWNFVVGLLDVVLEGIDTVRYEELLDELRGTLVARTSPAVIDAALAVLEMAAFHPVPNADALDALASVVIGVSDRFAHRLHRDQLTILELCSKDLGGTYEEQARELVQRLDSGSDGAEGDLYEKSLSGQLVGIYSLEEHAADRAKLAIESAYDGVRVEIDASHVATPALRRLAQNADEMIVATRAAKHAATVELESILRRRGLRPIFPAGKGATSMLRALRERVARA